MIYDFAYFAPKEVQEALELLAAHAGQAKVLAGGQSFLILLRQGLVAPENIIDVKGLGALDYLRSSEDGGLRIGALCTHRTVELSPLTQQGAFAALSEMEQNLASVETRNWGTLAGNVCHADPAGDPAPLLIAFDASATVRSVRGERRVPLEDFSTDYYETVLAEDELLAEIVVPKPAPRSATLYRKATHLSGDHALASVAVSLTLDASGTCSNARLVLGAVNAIPTRAAKAEQLLMGSRGGEEVFRAVAEAAAEAADPVSDMHASDEYRWELIRVLSRQVAGEAWHTALGA